MSTGLVNCAFRAQARALELDDLVDERHLARAGRLDPRADAQATYGHEAVARTRLPLRPANG